MNDVRVNQSCMIHLIKSLPLTLMPDCSVYAKGNKKEKFDLSRVDFVIEFKNKSEDPFICAPSNIEKRNPHVC